LLNVVRSNRAEWLARVLAEQLRLNPPAPLDEVEVVVNTWPTSRWLGEQLAAVNGISALVRFPFPGSRLRQLVRAVLGADTEGDDPWRAERLVWTVLEVLPELLEQREAEPLRRWMDLHPANPDQLNRDRWLLARSLADAVDDYALYRPDALGRWLAGGADGMPEGLRWQPLLVRALAARLPSLPFGLQVQQAVEHLRQGHAPVMPLPARLRLFGLSNLAPVQVELLQALAGSLTVELFLLTPGPDLWQRSQQRRRELGESWTASPDGAWLVESPRLEGIMGRMGAEFQLLLEGSGECLLGSSDQDDLFADPVAMANSEGRDASLLEQLQCQLTRGEPHALSCQENDSSLLLMGCAGPWREVQLVRDRILRWMADDPSLQPRDVLVMTPDVERYAPLLASVFSDQDATGVDLPWRLTDRSQQNSPGLQQVFMGLLRLSADRLTASGLEALMANTALMSLQGLEQQEAMEITSALQRSGFRWGLDGSERQGDDTHSLRWCLDRWLLGLVLPEEPGLAAGGCAPVLGDLSLQKLERWWPLLDRLAGWIAQLRVASDCSGWVDRLRHLLKDLFGDGGDWAWELQAILQALEGWQRQAERCVLKLDVAVVIAVLDEALSADSGRFGHRSGALTISALEPMRAIPHRVIVLMGLDAAAFPRHRERPGFHLLEQQRRLGDPSSTDQDRYVLLEALLSTRQHLLISWNSRDERRGDGLPPCPPVQQWLSLLREQLGDEQLQRVLIEPAANPLDATNFIADGGGTALSCDRRLLEARRNLDHQLSSGSKRIELGLALPLHWSVPDEGCTPLTEGQRFPADSLESLERWLRAPQKQWLIAQGLEPGEWCDPVEDLAPLTLSELERHQLLQQRLSEELDQLADADTASWQTGTAGRWLERTRGQGRMPPGAAATLGDEQLERRWQSLQSTLHRMGPLRQVKPDPGSGSRPLLIAGDTAVLISTSRLHARSLLQGWLNHLLGQLNATPCSSAVVCRHDNSAKADQFQIAMRWKPIEKEKAETLITQLLSLADHGRHTCWPVPPDSGLSRALALPKGQDAADRAFTSRWHGGFAGWAERDQADMQLCFGEACDATTLLNAEGFDAAFALLYEPLLEARCP